MLSVVFVDGVLVGIVVDVDVVDVVFVVGVSWSKHWHNEQ